jgi:DNA-binding transcriptional MerR regulator
MNSFTIKDLENLTGIKAHTIRIWEQRYHFLKPNRTTTNIRHYSNDELKKILNISLLNKFGFKISLIDKMSENEVNEKILSLDKGDSHYEYNLNELVKNMVELNLESFESILDEHIAQKGIENVINQLIFPFMEKVGILWVTNHINPAQEHLVMNIIRRKLFVGIDGIKADKRSNKSVLLFLPESEYHELGLLYMYYIFLSRGIHVIYLGANVPLKDVAFVANIKKPDYLYTHLTAMGPAFNFEKFLTKASEKFAGFPIIISGYVTQSYEKILPSSVSLKKSFSEVMKFVISL